MESSHSRSRRLIAYGSSAKNPPKSKTTPARAPASNGLQSAFSPSSNASPRGRKLVDNGNGGKQAPGPDANTDAGIYDLPSSEDEDQYRAMRRKRRRHDADVIPHTQRPSVDPTCSAIKDVQNAAEKPVATEPRHKMVSPQAKKKRRNSACLQKPRTGDALKASPSPAKATMASSSGGACRTSKPDIRPPGSKKTTDPQKMGSNDMRVTPSSPMRKVPVVGNTTSSRRRLVDSLGTKDRPRSADKPSSDASPDSPSSPLPRPPQTPPGPTDIAPLVPNTGRHGSHGPDSNTTLSPRLTGSRVTYARQRSFLDDLSIADNLSSQDFSASLEQRDTRNRRGDHEDAPRARLFAIEEANADDGSVRSIHELRRAGGTARYQGAIESIFEDIEDADTSVSGRCNALVQLCKKLLDSKLARQFVECNFDKRLIDCLSPDMDFVSVVLILCAFSLSSLERTLPYVLATAAWPRLLDISIPLLAVRDDISVVVRAQDNGISKPIQRLVQNLAPQVRSKLMPDYPGLKLSPCLLALQCLKAAVSSLQAKGENSTLPTPWLRQLVDLLLLVNTPVKTLLIPEPERAQILILGLSILEAHTVSRDIPAENQCATLRLLAGMHGLLGKCDESDMIGHQVRMLYLRVVLNVTNSNPTLCDDFATPSIIGGLAEAAMTSFDNMTEVSLSQENNPLDTVILALGALINLAEKSEASRATFLDSACTTPPLLSRLLRLFLDHVDSTSKVRIVSSPPRAMDRGTHSVFPPRPIRFWRYITMWQLGTSQFFSWRSASTPRPGPRSRKHCHPVGWQLSCQR